MRAGQGSVGDFLSLVLALRNDPNATVLGNALGKVGAVNTRIATDDDRMRLAAVMRAQFGPVYAALGKASPAESQDKIALRAELFRALAEANDPAIIGEARSLTERSFKDKKAGDPLLLNAAIDVAAANGDTALYEKVLAMTKDESDPVQQADAINTLTLFTEPALVTRTLDYAVSGQIRNQSSWIPIAVLLSRRATQEQAWTYVQNNWAKVTAQFTSASGTRIVNAVGSFCTAAKRDEVSAFFATHKVEASERTLAKSIDTINACIQLRADQEPSLKQWLDARK